MSTTPIEIYRELVSAYGEGVTSKNKVRKSRSMNSRKAGGQDKQTNERHTDRPTIELFEGFRWDVLTYSRQILWT